MVKAIALLEASLADVTKALDGFNLRVLNSIFLKDGSVTGFCQDKLSGLIFEFLVGEDIKYAAYFGDKKKLSLLTSNDFLLSKWWYDASDFYNHQCQCKRNDSTPPKKRTCTELPCGNSCISTKYTCNLKGSKQLGKKTATRLKSLNYIAQKIKAGEPVTKRKTSSLTRLNLNPQARIILKEISKNNLSVGAIASSLSIPKDKLSQVLVALSEDTSPSEISKQLQLPNNKVAEIVEQIAPFLPQSDLNAAIQKVLQENSFDLSYKQDDDEREEREDSSNKSKPCGNSFISSRYTCHTKTSKKPLSKDAKRAIEKGFQKALKAKKISKIEIFKRYKNNLTKAGKLLKNDPSQIEDMKLGKYAEKPRKTDKEQLTFFLAGLSDKESDVEAAYKIINKQFNKEGFFDKTELFAMTQERTNRSQPIAALNVAGGHLVKGENPDAKKIAKHILEWKQKNPHAKVNLLGHSGGGLTAKDVAYILNEAGVDKNDIKTLTLGTPYLDIYENKTPTKNIINKDEVFNNVPIRNNNLTEIVEKPNVENNLDNTIRFHQARSYSSPYFKTQDGKYIKNPAYKKVTKEMRDFFELA